jgi:hypothetical protein
MEKVNKGEAKMRKDEALKNLRMVQGKQYEYIKEWGLSTIKASVNYLSYRKLTNDEKQLLEDIEVKLQRKY